MDEIQRELCKLGRRDLAQRYYLKYSDAESPVLVTESPTEPKIIQYGVKSGNFLAIHFERVPGLPCFTFGCINEMVEKFYTNIHERLENIKKIAEGIGSETVVIPPKDSIFISRESLTCTICVSAEELLLDQIIARLQIKIKNEQKN